jgi:hypothetical protein
VVECAAAEAAGPFKPCELGSSEARSLDEGQNLLEAGRHQEVPLAGQLADEELEQRELGHAGSR